MNTIPLPLAFGFSNLAILGWLAAAAAPLIIHLWMKHTHRELPWAAIRFLQAAILKHARRLQFQQWLLLAIRTAILLLIVFIPSLPICFIRPFYGIILWIIVAFLNPQAYTWSSFDALPWAAAVAVPTILGMLVSERKFERLASREMFLLFAMWVWFTLTSLISTNTTEFLHHRADTWERWWFVSKILLMTACMVPILLLAGRG